MIQQNLACGAVAKRGGGGEGGGKGGEKEKRERDL